MSAASVGNVVTKAGQNAGALEHANQQMGQEASAFDVWTHSYDGMADRMRGFADDPAGALANFGREQDAAVAAGLTGDWHSSSFSAVGDSIAAQADGLGDMVNAIGEAEGALATVGATFALLTGVEQMLSTLVSVIPFPALPAIRIMDMDVGLPHGHMHPPNLVPPAPMVPLPSTGPIIPIPILSGATRTLINGMPAARCGDMGLGIWCGGYFPMYEVFLGSSSVWIEGARAGRLAVDITKHCIFTSPKPQDLPLGPMVGVTIMASGNVLIGGVPMPSLLSLAMGAAIRGLARGLGKAASAARRFSRRIQQALPEGSRLRRAMCAVTGHPVDVSSGRVFTEHEDFALAGHIPIQMLRTYDTSAVNYVGPFGPGWTHPFDVHLWVDYKQNMIILRDREARPVGFERIAVGAETFNLAERLWLSRVAEWQYVLRDTDGLLWLFGVLSSERLDDSDLGFSEGRALRLIAVQDRNDNQLRCEYERHLLVRLIDNAGRALVFAHRERTPGHPRLSEIRLFSADTEAIGLRLVSYDYDENERLVGAWDGERHATRYAYQGALLVRETNRNGLSFYFEYDGTGPDARCIRTWGDGGIYARTLAYNPAARTASVTDSLNATTSYLFDGFGRTLQIRGPRGNVVTFEYDAAGNLISEIDEEQGVTQYAYDELGNRIRVQLPDGTATESRYHERALLLEATDALGGRWRFEYDERGNIIARIDPLGHRWSYEYDGRGNWLIAHDPMGRVTHYRHDARGLTTRVQRGEQWYEVAYDDFGNVVLSRDALGATDRFFHDANGRVIVTLSPDGRRSRSAYDGEGNLVEHEDGEGRTTRWTYEGMNKVSAQIDPAGLVIRLRHDTEGRLVEIQNELGERFQFEYDPDGNVIRQVGFDGAEWKFEYNGVGGVTRSTDPRGRTIIYERDARNRLIRKRLPNGITKQFAYDPAGRIVEASGTSRLAFEYDAVGRLTSETHEDAATRHEYDAAGRRIRRISHLGNDVTYRYGAGGELIELITGYGAIRFTTDATGRLIERSSPGQLTEARSYDISGRLTKQKLTRRNQLLAFRTYDYDGEWNLVRSEDGAARTRDIHYDSSERLSSVAFNDRTQRFRFDAAGNLVNDSDRQFEYGAGNRLMRAGEMTFAFDALGSLIEQRRGDDRVSFEYDTENQLTAVTDQHGRRVEFSYDAIGRRVAKRTPDDEYRFTWDGFTLLGEENGANSAEYVIDPSSFEPICRLLQGRFEAFHNDYLGTPHEITNGDGEVVWAGSYHPYGQPRDVHVNLSPNPIRFKGQYADEETGLYYNTYRYYSPELCRYLNQDPFGLHAGLNQYRYTHNPINWTDPLGLFPEFAIAPYGNAGHVRDGLDADEMLQSAWMRHHGYGNRSSSLGRQNPAVALDPSFHRQVSAAQSQAGLFDPDVLRAQTAGQNIRANAKIRTDLLTQRFINEGMNPRAAARRARAIMRDLERQALAFVRANRLIRTC